MKIVHLVHIFRILSRYSNFYLIDHVLFDILK